MNSKTNKISLNDSCDEMIFKSRKGKCKTEGMLLASISIVSSNVNINPASRFDNDQNSTQKCAMIQT